MVRQRTVNPEHALEGFLQGALWAMLASGFLAAALAGALDRPSIAAGAAALAGRLVQITGLARFKLPRRWATLATACYLLFVPADYLLISRHVITTTVHVIVIAAALKLLSARTGRDSVIMGLIAFVAMVAAAVCSTSLTFLVLLMLFWAATLAALGSAEIRGAMRGRATAGGIPGIGGRLGLMTGAAGVGVLVLSVALFFVVPRTARVALERLMPGVQHVSGFAPEFTLGQPGEMRRSSAPMLHVRFADGEPRTDLHWRGTALAEFDGRRWFNSPRGETVLRAGASGYVQLVSDDQRRRLGPRTSYEVVQHGGSEYLFFAGLPENVRLNGDLLVRTPSGGVKLPFGENQVLRYAVYSYLGAGAALDESPPHLSIEERQFHLRLPPVDGRTLFLARAITAGESDDDARARSIERYLRTHFTYSLDAVESDRPDPLADFLFERKKGHCEYFASAMAVMLRELWIPSRVVTGYLGGAANPLTGWLVVRASDAHAWVEAWIPGQGWTTYDPTPAGESWSGAGGWWSKVGLYLDAGETFWQEWVVGYDLDRQLTLAFHVGQSRRLGAPWLERNWKRLAGAWRQAAESSAWRGPAGKAGAAAALALLALAVLWRRIAAALTRRRAEGGPAEAAQAAHEAARLYRGMLAALHKRGIEKAAFQTAGEFAAGLRQSEAAPLVAEFTASYHALRYGQEPEQATRMAMLLRQIEALPR
jgi:hypothetical protein